jgi:glutathione peroxidase
MKLTTGLLAALFATVFALEALADNTPAACPPMFNTSLRVLHSQQTINLCDRVKGHPVLVINTASHCGFTPQFKGLEKLHQTYKDKGLVVIGFASDDFFQEDNSEEEAATICHVNFGVTFTMLAPTHVRGDKANAVFAEINRQSSSPSWNFNKYLIDANGKVVQHFGSRVSPDDASIAAAIDKVLLPPMK